MLFIHQNAQGSGKGLRSIAEGCGRLVQGTSYKQLCDVYHLIKLKCYSKKMQKSGKQ